MGKKKSSKPSGLKITRNGFKFICEWKIPSGGYGDGQNFYSRTVLGKAASSVGSAVTKKIITLSAADLYPYTAKKLTSFIFGVRGNRDAKKDKYVWSDYAETTLNLYVPRKPTVTIELTGTNETKLTWSVEETGESTNRPFTRVEIQTKLAANCTWTPESDNWSEAAVEYSTAASGDKTLTESSQAIAEGSHTRLYRVRAVGPAGDSAWAYAEHVFAAPNESEQKADENAQEISGGYDTKVEWNTAYDLSRPIDESTVEWAITEPNSDLSCPSTGVSWQSAVTIKDTKGAEAVHVVVNQTLDDDQCLYTRINTKHDSQITYGEPTIRKRGKLKAPTGLTVEDVNQAAQTAKITAENQSAVDDAILLIIYRKNGSNTIVGVIDSSPDYRTVKCPAWEDGDSVSFGVKAVLPESIQYTTTDGVTIYTIKPYMESDTVWQGGTVAVAPTGVSAMLDGDNVRVNWTSNWEEANNTELSWSDNPNAWESTEDPSRYTIDNPFASSWLIAGLDTGKTWYIKVRSIYDSGEGKTYSPYSETAEVNLSSSPGVPTLSLSKGAIPIGALVTASWDYNSTDGTPQDEAVLYEYDNGSYTEIARTQTQEYFDLPGWDEEGLKQICVEVMSASGRRSGKSALVTIVVAEPAEINVTHSLEETNITDDAETTRTALLLTSLPMTVGVTGAGIGGTTAVIIERRAPYHVERPDEKDTEGYEGETIVNITQQGEDQIVISTDDLKGSLDDGGQYRLIAMIIDSLGQKATEEIEFEVDWDHKADIPSAEVRIDEEDLIAVITPIAPDNSAQTDTCDIYRLSADLPELIIERGAFGTDYVDPYPAFGETGGYRIVTRTAEDSYITGDNTIAFYDTTEEGESLIPADQTIIDFDGQRVALELDMKLADKWKKDFEVKNFLGGAIRGYWGAAVNRSGSIEAVVMNKNLEDIDVIRRLAIYGGECHVRTPDGSSYAADIQISSDQDGPHLTGLSMTITKVDSQGFEGMTLQEWNEGGM